MSEHREAIEVLQKRAKVWDNMASHAGHYIGTAKAKEYRHRSAKLTAAADALERLGQEGGAEVPWTPDEVEAMVARLEAAPLTKAQRTCLAVLEQLAFKVFTHGLAPALAERVRRLEADKQRLDWLLSLIWEIDRMGEGQREHLKTFKRLRRAIQDDNFPFRGSLDAALAAAEGGSEE